MLRRSTSGCRCGRDWRIGGLVMETPNLPAIRALRPAWNKGRIVGQKRPLKPKHVWAIRVRLELAENHRDLALFNMAIDSKLRGKSGSRRFYVGVNCAIAESGDIDNVSLKNRSCLGSATTPARSPALLAACRPRQAHRAPDQGRGALLSRQICRGHRISANSPIVSKHQAACRAADHRWRYA